MLSCSNETQSIEIETKHAAASMEIRELLKRFDSTLNSMDVESIISFYSEDVSIFPPDQVPIVGKENVKLWHQTLFKEYKLEEHHHPVQTFDHGEIVLHWGNATGSLTPHHEGEVIQFDNKYIHVFRRDSVGGLKLAWGMFNTNPSH